MINIIPGFFDAGTPSTFPVVVVVVVIVVAV